MGEGECEYKHYCPVPASIICYYPFTEKCLLWKLATKAGVDFKKTKTN